MIYRLQYNTAPVDRDDRGINIASKLITVDIIDAINAAVDGIQYTIAPSTTAGFNDFTFVSGVRPAGASTVKLYYSTDNGGSWTLFTTISVDVATPTTFTIADGIYKIEVDYGSSVNTFILGGTDIIPLQGSGTPFVVKTINNDEDKFLPIAAKQATIRFLSDRPNGISTTTFSDAPENKWLVRAYTPEGMIFTGYLVLADMSMPFLPDPQEVVLTATDGLPLLKDITLTEDDGSALVGKYRIAELVAICLKKTQLNLEIVVINNLRPGAAQFSFEVSFSSVEDAFVTANANARYFYIGQQLTITGTSSNNGTATVTDVAVGVVTIVALDINTTLEENVTATFQDGITGHFYDKVYLDAKTFEASIGVSENCYTALEKILGQQARIFQHNNQWWIINLDEYDSNPLYKALFDANGVLDSYLTADSDTFPIGITEDICHANRNTILRSERPKGLDRLIYNYRNPAEIVCNIDFSRGAVTTAPDLTAPTSEGQYTPECWTLHRYSGGSPTSTMYIKKVFEYGYQKEGYLVITPASSSSETTWAQCQPIPVVKKDKANVSVTYSAQSDFGSGEGLVEYDIVFIWIVDANGEYWYWTDLDMGGSDKGYYSWEGPFASEQNRPVSESWVLDEVDETEPRTLTVNVGPFPIDGDLYLGLPQFNQTGSSFDNSVTIQYNLSFDLVQYINGSYNIYSGQSNTVIRNPNTGYTVKHEQEVFLADSPRPTFKGALFFLAGSVYKLLSLFYRGHVVANGNPASASDIHPFGKIQAYNVWNQLKQAYRIFPSTLYGLLTADDTWPDLWQKYVLTDSEDNTDNRYFVLISFEQNWKSMIWTGTFVEVYRTDIGHEYGDTFEFKYITGS